MKTEELTRVSEELEEKLKELPDNSARADDGENGIVSLIHKALDMVRDSTTLRKGQSNDAAAEETVVEEEVVETTTEKLEKSEKAGQENTYQALTESPVGKDLDEMTDATPVLAEMIDVFAKSQGQTEAIYKSLAEQDEKIDAIATATAALLKGFEALYTTNMAQPRRMTSQSVVIAPTDARTPQNADLRAKVLKAISEERVDPHVYSWFDTRTDDQIIAALPAGVLD